MEFQRGDKIEVFKQSNDEAWEAYMDDFIGCHGYITDPDTTVNDPDALIEVSLVGKGTHRLPQDCLRCIGGDKMTIKNLLESHAGELHTVTGDQTVAQALGKMSAYGASALLVVENGLPAGIFTERDFVRCHLLFPDKKADGVAIAEVMTTSLIVAEPGDTVENAMAMMTQAKIRHLPVIGDKKIVGLIALEDLVKVHIGALTQELHYLKDYISDLQDAAHD